MDVTVHRAVSVRRAGEADLTALLPLVRGYREFYEQPADGPNEREYMRAHLAAGTSTIFLAERDGVAVGFAQIFPTYSTVRLGPAFVLEDLFVEPNVRGSGVANALLSAVLAFARERRAVGLHLETALDNETAQRVYERNGWTREGRFFKYNAPL